MQVWHTKDKLAYLAEHDGFFYICDKTTKEWFWYTESEDSLSIAEIRGDKVEDIGFSTGIKINITGEESVEDLKARGLSRTTLWRARKNGWYILKYHQPEYIQYDGAGAFNQIKDPFSFAISQVRRVLNSYDCLEDFQESIEDFAQEGLLLVWERRFEQVTDFVAFAATIVCRLTKDKIGYERRRQHKPLPREDQ